MYGSSLMLHNSTLIQFNDNSFALKRELKKKLLTLSLVIYFPHEQYLVHFRPPTFTSALSVDKTIALMSKGCRIGMRPRSTRRFIPTQAVWITYAPNVICDVICEKGPYYGRNIVGPDQTPRIMRGVWSEPTIFIVHRRLQNIFLSLTIQFESLI